MKHLNKPDQRLGLCCGKISLLLSLLSFVTMDIMAQCRYDVPVYGQRAEKNVFYGIQKDWAGRDDSLRIDIYKPVGDGNSQRPLLMLVHGGGFSSGDKSDIEEVCRYVASCGVVCVSLEYRLGFVRPLQFNYPYTYDQAEVFRAIYRAQQDAKGALRYLKGRYQLDSTDRSQVYSGGFSAGGFIALATAYFTDSSLRFPSSRAIASAITPNGTYVRPDLGGIDGPLHQNGENASVRGVFNFFGAVHDTSIIRPGGPNIWQYHQTGDPVVPCGRNKPYHGIGLLIPDNYPAVSGSCNIQTRLINLGDSAPLNTHIIHNGNQHDVHNIETVRQNMLQTLSDWVCAWTNHIETSVHSTSLIYPNPSDGKIVLPQEVMAESLTIFDLNGKECFSKKPGDDEKIIHTDLKNGSYVLLLKTQSGQWFRQVILIAR